MKQPQRKKVLTPNERAIRNVLASKSLHDMDRRIRIEHRRMREVFGRVVTTREA